MNRLRFSIVDNMDELQRIIVTKIIEDQDRFVRENYTCRLVPIETQFLGITNELLKSYPYNGN